MCHAQLRLQVLEQVLAEGEGESVTSIISYAIASLKGTVSALTLKFCHRTGIVRSEREDRGQQALLSGCSALANPSV